MTAILKKLAFWGLPSIVLCVATNAFATSLAPGDTLNYGQAIPFDFGSLPGTEYTKESLSTFDLTSLTLITSTGLQAYSTVNGAGNSESGEAVEDVFQNADLTLDFVYQFTVTSSTVTTGLGTIDHIAVDAYSPLTFSTDVYYGSPTPSTGSLAAPSSGVGVTGSASRSGGGTVVNFSGLSPAVGAGSTSPIFVVKTNATDYTVGSFNLLDDGSANLSGYEPGLGSLPPVGLPATCNTGLLLLGCVGGFGAIRRRLALA